MFDDIFQAYFWDGLGWFGMVWGVQDMQGTSVHLKETKWTGGCLCEKNAWFFTHPLWKCPQEVAWFIIWQTRSWTTPVFAEMGGMQTIETTPQVVFVLGCHMCHVVPFRARGPLLHHAQLAEMMLAMQRRSRVTSYQYMYIYIYIIYTYIYIYIHIWVVHPDESSGFIVPGLTPLFNPIQSRMTSDGDFRCDFRRTLFSDIFSICLGHNSSLLQDFKTTDLWWLWASPWLSNQHFGWQVTTCRCVAQNVAPDAQVILFKKGTCWLGNQAKPGIKSPEKCWTAHTHNHKHTQSHTHTW